MKKLIALLFAVASTLFLFAGVSKAAEKFDSISSKSTSLSGSVMDGPGLPCVMTDDN